MRFVHGLGCFDPLAVSVLILAVEVCLEPFHGLVGSGVNVGTIGHGAVGNEAKTGALDCNRADNVKFVGDSDCGLVGCCHAPIIPAQLTLARFFCIVFHPPQSTSAPSRGQTSAIRFPAHPNVKSHPWWPAAFGNTGICRGHSFASRRGRKGMISWGFNNVRERIGAGD